MNVDAAGTKVSGRSRQGGRGSGPSGVVVKRGSTVYASDFLLGKDNAASRNCHSHKVLMIAIESKH